MACRKCSVIIDGRDSAVFCSGCKYSFCISTLRGIVVFSVGVDDCDLESIRNAADISYPLNKLVYGQIAILLFVIAVIKGCRNRLIVRHCNSAFRGIIVRVVHAGICFEIEVSDRSSTVCANFGNGIYAAGEILRECIYAVCKFAVFYFL